MIQAQDVTVFGLAVPHGRIVQEDLHKTTKAIHGISQEAMDMLVRYPWPGNIRELINAFDYAFVVCRTNCIEPNNLPKTIAGSTIPPCGKTEPKYHGELESVMKALRQTDGKRKEAARLLGITRQALWKKMLKLGIKNECSFAERKARGCL